VTNSLKPHLPAVLAALFLACTLAACDTVQGVSRTQTLAAPIDYVCFENAIRATPGVRRVRTSHTTDSSYRLIPLRGGVVTVSDAFFYETDDAYRAMIQVLNDDGAVSFEHSHGCLGCEPSQEAVDALAPVMTRIETSIQNACAIDLSAIRQSCRGVRCGGSTS
jgi:hypothetical protein